MYASMYRDLAAASGLYYYRLPSDKPAKEHAEMFYEDPWYDKCDGPKNHISSPAAFLDYECNSRSKSSPVMLNLEKLKATLELALDDIGCRDAFCQEQWWYKDMKKEGAHFFLIPPCVALSPHLTHTSMHPYPTPSTSFARSSGGRGGGGESS